MLYRIHERLLVNRKNGTYIAAGEGKVHALPMVSASAIQVLLRTGAISEVQAPPLDVFTGWRGRARVLDRLGIDTVAFVSMDAHDVAYAMRAALRRSETPQEDFDERVDKLARAVERWQCEIKGYLGIDGAEVRR